MLSHIVELPSTDEFYQEHFWTGGPPLDFTGFQNIILCTVLVRSLSPLLSYTAMGVIIVWLAPLSKSH